MGKLVSFICEDDSDIVPHFLRHYRALGVQEFHVFLHGDWRREALRPLEAADVVIAGLVQEPYSDLVHSSRIETFARQFPGEWLIIADADEFLELPYPSLARTMAALSVLGLEELPAVLLQRTTADGSLPTLGEGDSPSDLFPCFDFLLAERMFPSGAVCKSRYPLVKIGPDFRNVGGNCLPHSGRSSSHYPIRGLVHHFKWRDTLPRGTLHRRWADTNQPERDAYRAWLKHHEFKTPSDFLQRYSRERAFELGFLRRPSRSQILRFGTLRKCADVRSGAIDAPQACRKRLLAIPSVASPGETGSLLDRTHLFSTGGRIALVTAELTGFTNSGGIGTAMGALAERLAANGHEVHVFFCPHSDEQTPSDMWMDYWAARGVRVRYFPRSVSGGRYSPTDEFSTFISEHLALGDWDVIHFHEAGGLAAAALLCRAGRLGFRDSRIVVTVHGPTHWHNAGNFDSWWADAVVQKELESIAIELADVVVCPSVHMADWCRSHYRRRGSYLVIPNLLFGETRSFRSPASHPLPVDTFAFVGRVERRKGIDLFLDALDGLASAGAKGFEVLVVGRPGTYPQSTLAERLGRLPHEAKHIPDLSGGEVLDLLRSRRCMVLAPSRMENSPYVVYECLENGIPVYASDVGGTGELVLEADRPRTVGPTDAASLTALMLDALKNGVVPSRLSFDADLVDFDHLALHAGLVEVARSEPTSVRPSESTFDGAVIVHGKPEAELKSVLSQWARTGAEILSAEDAPASKGAGNKAAHIAESRGAACNRLALSARSHHLLFCRSSVLPDPEAFTSMMAALAATGADSVVCGFRRKKPDGSMQSVPAFGGPPELCTERDVYGAGLFAVRKDSFQDAAGFCEEGDVGPFMEQELLNRMRAMGMRVTGVPAPLATVSTDVVPAESAGYAAGRLAAAWVEAAPQELQGFVGRSFYTGRRLRRLAAPESSLIPPGPNAVPPAVSFVNADVGASLFSPAQLRHAISRISERFRTGDKPAATPDRPPGPDIGALDMTGAATIAEPQPTLGWIATATPAATGEGIVDAMRVPLQATQALIALGTADADENAFGRSRVLPDGVLQRTSHTFDIQSAADAAGCDFLVTDDVLTSSECATLKQAFAELEATLYAPEVSELAWSERFIWLEDFLKSRPHAGQLMIESVRRSVALTQRFYETRQSIRADHLEIVRWQPGMHLVPEGSRANGAPANPNSDFTGLLFLNDEFSGGEIYFTALDFLLRPRSGMVLVTTSGTHHEYAVLRAQSGTRLVMRFSLTLE